MTAVAIAVVSTLIGYAAGYVIGSARWQERREYPW